MITIAPGSVRPLADFDDAIVATLAHRNQCDHVVTRNASAFTNSSVPALTPGDFLTRHS